MTHFVTGLGTSGTMMGTTRRLHEHTPRVTCVAVEPAEALHGLEGLKHMGSSIVPPIYDEHVPDEILPISTEEGWDMSDKLAATQGLHVGHSTGANVAGAVRIAERAQKERGGGCVVTIACDRGDRYFAPLSGSAATSGEETMTIPEWTLGGVKIPATVLGEIERAGKAAYARDEEACGYLEGPATEPLVIDRAVELENLANKYHQVDPEGHPRTGREYFKINSKKFERAISEGSSSGRPVKVFFHSHLDCGAYFSAEDAASMTLGGSAGPTYDLAYLVTAVDQGEVSAHRFFVWDARVRAFVEAPFERV